MSRVSEILQALAENAGQAQLRQGAIYGGLVSGASQLPAQISADKEHDAALKLQQAHLQQQMDLERSRAAREDQLARHGAAIDARAQEYNAAVSSGLAAAMGTVGPAQFDAKAAFDAVSKAGHPEAIRDVIAQHRSMQAPLTEHDPTKALRDPSGAIVVPAVPKSPTNAAELAWDAG